MADWMKAYSWAVGTCNAPNVGYSQDYRNQQTVGGITYYDCSSFIWYALKVGGFDVETAYKHALGYGYGGNAITTHNLINWLAAMGWVEHDISDRWPPGAVLWKSGHTEMVYAEGADKGHGRTMGAHSRFLPLDQQVSINEGVTGPGYFTRIMWPPDDSGGEPEQPGVGTYTKYVVAAIAGNWWWESNINPGIWEGLKPDAPGYGLGQWTDNSETDRKTKLFEWLDQQGYPRDSAEGQIKYFIFENVWYSVGDAAAFNSLKEFLSSDSTDIAMLTNAFMRGWEGISDGTDGKRRTAARKVLMYLEKHANDDSIHTWVVGNRYLTEAEILNNAVLLFRALGGGGGGGGQQWPNPGTNWPTDGRKHKWWIYMRNVGQLHH